jgi:tetratricopeptide (TPR) repeat protein
VAAYYVTPTPVLWSEPPFLALEVAAAGLSALLVVMRKRWPALLATWTAFLVILIPVAGFAPQGEQLVSDRYTYLAAMALVPLMAAGLIRLASSDRDRGPWCAVVVAVTATGVVAALTGQTRALCRTWHDSESLWVHALAHGARRSLAVHNNLAAEYYRQERIDQAIATWQAALTIPHDPSDVSGRVLILSNLGTCLERGDRPDEAIARFAEAARLAPQSAAAHYQWGRALAAAGRYDAAIPRFARALALDPHHEAARSALDQCRRGRGASLGGPDLGLPIP